MRMTVGLCPSAVAVCRQVRCETVDVMSVTDEFIPVRYRFTDRLVKRNQCVTHPSKVVRHAGLQRTTTQRTTTQRTTTQRTTTQRTTKNNYTENHYTKNNYTENHYTENH